MDAETKNAAAFQRFVNVFRTEKPVIGMLHLSGGSEDEALRIAREEIGILYGAGVDAVMAENYYGGRGDVENVLAMLREEYPDRVYGVNVLGDFEAAFRLAERYGAAFVQVDSICGHLDPYSEKKYFKRIDDCRAATGVFLMGGVRFKFQPVFSGRSTAEDVRIGMRHCDAVVVTGDSMGKGNETPMEKILQFREALGNFPLIVGAGLTPEVCAEQLAVADGGIVGSYIKYDGEAHNRMDPARVKAFMRACRGAD